MKQAEPKNPVWDSTRSTLVTAVIDRCNMRFVAVGLLSMVIDLLVFQVLFASGANLELSQIISFFAGALLSFALNADGGASELKQSSSRWTLYARFLLVALLAAASAQRCSHAASRELALATANSDPRGDPDGRRCFSRRRGFFYISSIRCE